MKRKQKTLSPERQARVDFLKSFPGLRVAFGEGRPDKDSPFYDLWLEQQGRA